MGQLTVQHLGFALGGEVTGIDLRKPEESAPILGFLNQHATSPEFVYRHRWSVNDLVMWDNRCTLHVALPDFDQARIRHMTRTSLVGEVTGRVLQEGAAPEKEALLQVIASRIPDPLVGILPTCSDATRRRESGAWIRR